jgi:hypothetical protein
VFEQRTAAIGYRRAQHFAWASIAERMASESSSHRRVETSMSVHRNVTISEGMAMRTYRCSSKFIRASRACLLGIVIVCVWGPTCGDFNATRAK